MKNVVKFFGLSALLMCFALFTGSVFAQSATTGSVEGVVTDANGAAVPGITVKAKSPNSISAQTATTDEGGRFKILNLPPGKYSVEIEAEKGFSKFEKTDVEVNLSRTASVEISLQPQGATANVTVTDTSGAAVDVSNDVSEAERLETLLERAHADHVVAADVHATQQRDKYILMRF